MVETWGCVIIWLLAFLCYFLPGVSFSRELLFFAPALNLPLCCFSAQVHLSLRRVSTPGLLRTWVRKYVSCASFCSAITISALFASQHILMANRGFAPVVFNLFCTATHCTNPLYPNNSHLKLEQNKCSTAVCINYLLATSPKMVHDTSGLAPPGWKTLLNGWTSLIFAPLTPS